MAIPEERRRQLRALFPEVSTEDRIDFNQFKRGLGAWVETGRERFDLNWPGKAECMRIIQQPSAAALKPPRDESVIFDKTENYLLNKRFLSEVKGGVTSLTLWAYREVGYSQNAAR